MRKPKTDGSPADDTSTAGGRALERARQFARQRGLPPPDGEADSGSKKIGDGSAEPPPPAPANPPARPARRAKPG